MCVPAAAAECELVSPRAGGVWRGGHCAKKATSTSDGARARAAGPQRAVRRQSILQARLMGTSFGPVGRWIATIEGLAGLLCRRVMPSELSGIHVTTGVGGVTGVGGGEESLVAGGGSLPLEGGALSEVF